MTPWRGSRALVPGLAVFVAFQLWQGFDFGLGNRPFDWFAHYTLMNLLFAAAVVPAVLLADRAIARGTPRAPAYAAALLAGTAIAAVVQYPANLWLGLPIEEVAAKQARHIWQPLRVFFEYLLWCTAALGVYASLRARHEAAQRLHTAQAARDVIRRRAVEARLHAAQARVDPALLTETLTRVHDAWLADDAGRRPEVLIDALVAYLRAAQTDGDASPPTVAQALDLVRAYAALQAALRGGEAGAEIRAAPGVGGRRLPPQVLLPLVERALAAGARLQIDVRAEDRMLCLTIDIEGSGIVMPVEAVRERLRLLCGAQAEVTADARTLVLRIPDETSDGTDR